MRVSVMHDRFKRVLHYAGGKAGNMKRKQENPFIGTWRIVWMKEWDQDYVDMEVQGHFTFNEKRLGNFQFGLIQGELDWRVQDARLEFTWDGCDEGDQISGRGWAEIKQGELVGQIFIHLGDDSEFRAVRQSNEET